MLAKHLKKMEKIMTMMMTFIIIVNIVITIRYIKEYKNTIEYRIRSLSRKEHYFGQVKANDVYKKRDDFRRDTIK